MAIQTFSGKTEDAAAPFLTTEFWTAGKKIVAIVDRVFDIDGRNNYAVRLMTPHTVLVEGEMSSIVSIGESGGLRMAMQAARIPRCRLVAGDKLILECTGETPSKKLDQLPRKNFSILVERSGVPVDEEVGF